MSNDNNDNGNGGSSSADLISDTIQFAAGSTFNSKQEMQAAFHSPRYRNDAVYRNNVEHKIERTMQKFSMNHIRDNDHNPDSQVHWAEAKREKSGTITAKEKDIETQSPTYDRSNKPSPEAQAKADKADNVQRVVNPDNGDLYDVRIMPGGTPIATLVARNGLQLINSDRTAEYLAMQEKRRKNGNGNK